MDTLKKAFWCEEKDKKKFMDEVCEHLKTLDEELRNKKFFGGDNLGLVDIAANFVGYWLEAFEEALGLDTNFLTEDKLPDLCRWRDEYVTSQRQIGCLFASSFWSFQVISHWKKKKKSL